MASVVDELTVSLGLDASAFKRGLADTRANLKTTAEASTVTAKEMQAQGKRAGEFFSGIKTEALSLLGVLVGSAGLSAFVKDTASSFTALGYAAGNINLPVQELAAFRNMISENGGSADAAQSSLLSLANTMQGLKLGLGAPGQFLAGLNVIGGTYQDTPMAILQKFAQYSENVPKTQSNAIGRMLGLDQDTMNLTQRGVGYFMDHMQQAMQRGVPSKEMVERQTSFYRSLMDVGQAASFAGQAFLDKYVPGLTAASDALAKWISTNKEQAGTIEAGIASLMLLKPALWVLRALGLATLGETLAAVTIWSEATSAPDLNAGEAAALEAYRKSHGLPSGPANANMTPGATGNPNQQGSRQQAIDYFMANGYSSVAAAAAADTIGFESDFKSSMLDTHGGGQGARGIVGWRGDRIAAYVKRYGHVPDAGSFAENLEFMRDELAGQYEPRYGMAGVGLKGVKTEEEGVDLLNKHYTIPGSPYPAIHHSPTIPGPAAMHPAASNSNSNTTVSVGTVTVHTQATDAKGISVDIHQAIVDSWMQQANRGLN